MKPAIFGALRCKDDQLAIKINFRPSEPANLCAPLPSKQEQVHYVCKVPIAKTTPQPLEFVGCQHAITACRDLCLRSPGHHIKFTQPFGYRPWPKRGEGGA